MKRWMIVLSALCLALFVAFMQPVYVEAAESVTVYLDPAAGDDTADGLTEATPVKSYDTAFGKVKIAGGGTIVFLSTLEIKEDLRLPSSASTVPVVLTSKTGAEGISGTTNIRFNAPTTLENMTVTLAKASSAYMILAEGKKLVIGENVNTVGTDGYYFSISGGKRWASCASTDLTVQSGTWRNIYVGNYGHKSSYNVTGNAKLTMTGGKLTGFISPSYGNNMTVGSVDISLSNMSAASMYCAPVSSGTVKGDVNVTFGENVSFSGSVYAGGNGSGSVAGTVNLVLDGADTTGYDKLSGGGASDFSGTVGASRLLLKTGSVSVAPTNFTSVDVDIPAQKTLTISKCSVTADTVTAEGILAFTGIAKLTAGAVNGTVNCTIEGQQFNNHPYVTAPAGSAIVFADNAIAENNGVWINHDLENFQGLILTAEEDVTTVLYTGFDPESSSVKKVEPYATVGNTKYYPLLQGRYYYRASGTGYYKIKRNIYMTEEKATTKTVFDVTPGKKSGLGWESSNETIKYFTDEFFANAIPSDKSMWPQFADIFTTPAFGENRADHQFTTQTEMENFLRGLDDANDHMYIYSVGTSGRGQDMPLVLFTTLDLTGKTMEEAAALVVADSKANGKLTIHNQGFIHGNEPAGGEAALGMIKLLDGAYGESLLSSMNIYVLPRLNPDGAQDNLRRIPTWGLKDPNTDFAQLETKEMQNVVRAMNLFQPHVVFDNHEGNVTTTATTERYMGMLVNPRFSLLSNQEFKDLGITMVQNVFSALDEEKITYRYISDTVSSKGIGTILGYAGNQGMLAFLMESPGILHGRVNFERRVAGHIICLTTFYNYLRDNRADVKAIVEAERQRITESGKTFEESDIVVLESSTTVHEEYQITIPNYDGATGLLKKMETIKPKMADKIERSRPAPTAYVIPAGESWVADVMTIMDRHGVEYTKLPAGQTVLLRQYTGSRAAADLTDETAVSFPNGAYVFCMDQQKAVILSVLLEPDFTDTARTLTSGNGYYTATSGETHTYIAPVDGVFPIYRYEHDLNENGFIDLVGGEQETRGDLNNDGTVSDTDAMYLLRYTLFGEGRYPLNQSGDMNGDGAVSDADAMYLLRYTLFGESRYPLH